MEGKRILLLLVFMLSTPLLQQLEDNILYLLLCVSWREILPDLLLLERDFNRRCLLFAEQIQDCFLGEVIFLGELFELPGLEKGN